MTPYQTQSLEVSHEMQRWLQWMVHAAVMTSPCIYIQELCKD